MRNRRQINQLIFDVIPLKHIVCRVLQVVHKRLQWELDQIIIADQLLLEGTERWRILEEVLEILRIKRKEWKH